METVKEKPRSSEEAAEVCLPLDGECVYQLRYRSRWRTELDSNQQSLCVRVGLSRLSADKGSARPSEGSQMVLDVGLEPTHSGL